MSSTYMDPRNYNKPMTDKQRSFLFDLCRDTDRFFDKNLTRLEAAKRIDKLQRKRAEMRRAKRRSATMVSRNPCSEIVLGHHTLPFRDDQRGRGTYVDEWGATRNIVMPGDKPSRIFWYDTGDDAMPKFP